MINTKPQPKPGRAASTLSIHPPINTIMDALSFQLAHLTALNDRAGSHYFKKKHNLSLNEWRVLGLTFALEPVPLQDIRNFLLKDKGQLSRVVHQLVSRGSIVSEQSPTDARSQILSMTAKGKELHSEVIALTAERNERAVAQLSRSECETLMFLLKKLTRSNEKHFAAKEAGK